MSDRTTAERSLLGAAILDPTVLDEHGHKLAAPDWFRPQHAALWDKLRALRDDPQFSRQQAGWCGIVLEQAFDWGDAVEGAAYVASLPGCCPSVEVAPAMVRRVQDAAQNAAAKNAARCLLEALEEGTPTETALTEHEGRLEAIRHREALERAGWVRLGDTAAEVYDETGLAQNDPRARTRLVLPTGWGLVDHLLGGGLRPGEVTIIAGRPGTGKTAAAMQVAQQASGFGAVGVFSLEMTRAAIATRELARVGRVPLGTIQQAGPNEAEWRRLNQAVATLTERPIWVDDTPSLHIVEIRARSRRFAMMAESAGMKLSLLVVDYLQLATSTVGRNDTREREVARVSVALTALAKELRCPLVVLAQMNRAVENRTLEKPKKSDLRESGQIEQDATNIIFTHRDPDDEDENSRELVIAKARNGVEGTIPMRWEGEYQSLWQVDDRREPAVKPVRQQESGWQDRGGDRW